MNDDEFGWMVARLENQAANAPRAFRIKVVLISVAAYAALFLNLLLIALLLYWAFVHTREHGATRFAFVVGMLGLMTVPVFFVTLRTLFKPLAPPEGRAVTRAEAPLLFELLDKMRSKLDGPAIHHVLIDKDYNACIAQRPRWGLAGPSVNYLVIGLPFLFGQGTSEMLAVVAHEYGHLCGAHGSMSAWIYRQRLIFRDVYARLAQTSGSSFWHALMVKAFDAFMPYFNAYTFVLSRQNEYEADRAAARVAGAQAAATSLVRSSLLADWFHRDFWSALYRQADTRDRPAFLPYKAMATAFRMSHDDWASDSCLKAAWRRESDVDDTHPCLRARVEALGQQPALPAPLQRNSAAALLGAFGERLAEEFDQDWWRGEQQAWGERKRHVTRSQARLRILDGVPAAELPLHELQELSLLKAEFESAQAAKPLLEQLLRRPGGPFPMASYTYGRILLGEQRREGLDHLATAVRHDRRLADEALRLGFLYLLERDGKARAEEWVYQVNWVQPA
jgi:hypothetical protein